MRAKIMLALTLAALAFTSSACCIPNDPALGSGACYSL
jgi:hypothetical protein